MTSEELVVSDPSVLPVADKYQVVRKLASGGMGDVFLARQLGPVAFHRLVVLKSLHPDLIDDQDFVSMFLNEAQLIASLQHPNIIHIYELLQEPSGYLIAMEYVKGGNVLELLRESRMRDDKHGLPFGPALRIATSVCDALHYAYHERDAQDEPLHIIHRDVSPSNILVGFDGQVKLVDFGIAKALAAEPLTKTTTIKGKSGYLAPEQIRTETLDHRCDVFAAGVVLWEMTVGQRLFRRDNDYATMNAILHEEYPRPSERIADYPRALEEIVMTAMAKRREDRYPDAGALAADLRGLARDRDWDLESSALARMVGELLDDQTITVEGDPSTGNTRSPRFTPGRSPSPRHTAPLSLARGSGPGVAMTAPPVTAGASASLPRPAVGGAAVAARDGLPWTTIFVMLALSAVFWLLIVPRI
jgi:serine/threonine-protein kinase